MNKKQRAIQEYKPYDYDDFRYLWDLHYVGNRPVFIRKDHVKFMDILIETGSKEEAIKRTVVMAGQLDELLATKEFRMVYQDKLARRAIKESLDENWFLKEMLEIYGQDKEGFSKKERFEALKELGHRVAPKPERKLPGMSQPVININVGALEESLERRQKRAIDVESNEATD